MNFFFEKMDKPPQLILDKLKNTTRRYRREKAQTDPLAVETKRKTTTKAQNKKSITPDAFCL